MPLYNFFLFILMSNVLILIISFDECVADKKGQTSVSNGKVKEEPVSLNLHHQTFFTAPQFRH